MIAPALLVLLRLAQGFAVAGGSDIALATVHRLVERRARTVVLAAHHPDRLVDAADALRAAGADREALLKALVSVRGGARVTAGCSNASSRASRCSSTGLW